MSRYRTHDLRQVTDLSGVWDFAFLGDVDPDQVDVADDPVRRPHGRARLL